jgi:hypothetical protein
LDVNFSKEYLGFLFLLWIGQVGSAIWGWPIWSTISFMAFFAIYGGHEWIHVAVCKANDLIVEEINFGIGGKQDITFALDENDPEVYIKAAKVYLAGSAWDSIWYMIAALSAGFYAFYLNDVIPFIFGVSLIIVLISNLLWTGSDWYHYRNLTRV